MQKRLERRKQRYGKRAPFIDCHLLLQALLLPNMYHSLSLIQDLQEMKNTREEEEEKLQNGNETTPKTLHISNSGTHGGIYSHQRRESQAGTASQNLRPGRGHTASAIRGALSRALSCPCPVSSCAWFLVSSPCF